MELDHSAPVLLSLQMEANLEIVCDPTGFSSGKLLLQTGDLDALALRITPCLCPKSFTHISVTEALLGASVALIYSAVKTNACSVGKPFLLLFVICPYLSYSPPSWKRCWKQKMPSLKPML